MSKEKTFTKGLFVETKETKFGEIIKVSVKADEFINFLN